MSGDPLERAVLLLSRGRPAEAIVELERRLAEAPGDGRAHALSALGFADLERFEEALEASQRGIGASPEMPFAHYVNASVLLRMGKARRALEPAREALTLDPDDAEHYAMVASCHASLADWREALEMAERGLTIEPEDDRLVNLRALCLRQLGDVDGAEAALRSALTGDPENAWTFQNLGYSALQAGRADEAVAHFRESLRLDPTDEASREGLGEALKARVPLYRPVIAWQLLCGRLSDRLGVGLILGFFILAQVVRQVFPDGSPIGSALLIAYASFVWMSWAVNPLFDVLLLLRSDLRPVLTGREKVASCGVLLCLVLAVATLAVKFVWNFPQLEYLALAFAFAAIPTAGWANLPNGKARLTGIGMAAVALLAATAALGAALFVLHLVEWDRDFIEKKYPLAVKERVVPLLEKCASGANVSLLVSVASSWILTGLGFVPERRGGMGNRRRPR